MAALNVAKLDGDAVYSPPITFGEAWASIMTCRVKREWAFNRCTPAPNELLRARENRPFSKTFFRHAPTEGARFQEDANKCLMEELFCTTRRLPDGTFLGFVLNSTCIDFFVPCFAAFEPCFGDAQLDVARLICGTVAGRLYMIAFYWLKSGGLNVRFEPHQSLRTSKRNELRLDPRVYGFLPSDVPMLSVAALCPDKPSEDFVNARFENILISDDWYMLKVTDTCFQSACIFCTSRGAMVCDCPLPMRQRMGTAPDVIGYKMRKGKTCWDEYRTVMSICENRGDIQLSVIKAPDSRYAKLMDSSTFPFYHAVQLNVVTTECLQKHLRMTGRSMYATRTVLTPFSLRGEKRQSIHQPFSVKHITAPVSMSSVASSKPMFSQNNSSSSNESISLVRNTCKRARAARQVANFLSVTSDSGKPWSYGYIDTVVNVTNVVVNSTSLVTEEVSHNEKSRKRSVGSPTAVKNQGQSKVQSKVYPSLE